MSTAAHQPAAYVPPLGSLAQQVIDWLRANPEEELTPGDVAAKFGGQHTRTSVMNALRPGLRHGALALTAGSSSQSPVYCAPRPGAAKPRPHRGGKGRHVARATGIDVSAIAIEDNVPIAPQDRSASPWDELVLKLKPGQSALVPIIAAPALRGCVYKHTNSRRGKWTVLKVDAEHVRIWRKEMP